MYVAARDATGADIAFLITADGVERRLSGPSSASLSEALVTNYLMRPEQRFRALARQNDFIDALSVVSADGKAKGRIGVDFGSIGLCHVAAGFSDAMVEFAKGFAVWDLSPGHYILHAAGGTVTDLHGTPLPLDCDLVSMESINRAMNRRQTFIAAGNPALAEEICRSLKR
ncbi:inositol monophosphatase family protein [Nocardia sp. CA-290969]|uniref:inositol monophosphatase family protein n=1 Tax=Nocardia sp. CA-290969 TaxID=3239986 RepID=UPI003D950141